MNDESREKTKRSLRVSRSAMPDDRRRFPWFMGWLLIIAILAVFGIVIVRTQGAQQLLTERLSDRLGMDVSMTAARIGWPYDLVFEGLTVSDPDTPPSDGVRPLLELGELRVGWRGGRGPAVTVRRGCLSLRSDAEGRPSPARWAALSDLEDAAALSDWLLSAFGEGVRFHAEQMCVTWRSADDRILMHAENLAGLSVPVRVPRRRWRYFELSADRLMRADGRGMIGYRYEWLISGELTLIELGHRAIDEPGDGEALPPPPGQPPLEQENL